MISFGMCLASNRFFVMKFFFLCCCCSCFFGVHVFLSTTRGKLLTSRDVARYATTRRQCRRTCASILFFYSAILCSWSVSFPFLLKTKYNGTDLVFYFILRFGFGLSDRLCRGTIWPSLGFVWHDASRLTHDDHLYYLPSRLLLYMALVRTATRPFFMYVKDFGDHTGPLKINIDPFGRVLFNGSF
jgi:hypothetical protein